MAFIFRFAQVLILPILLLALNDAAQAHNLWVTAEGSTVRIVFEHSPKPGKGAYNAEILRNGETWVRTAGPATVTPVTVEETGELGARLIVGSAPATSPRAVEHSCLFGIYRGRLDFFYGKYLDVADARQLNELGRSARLPLDIVPALKGKRLEMRVQWKGELLTEHRFGAVMPDGEEISLQANAEGIVVFEPTEPGVYGFWVIRMDDEVSGVHEGENYSGTMHGSTLSLRWPLGGK